MIRILTFVFLQLTLVSLAASPGLAWPNQLYVPMAGFAGPGTAISSYYTWSPNPIIKPKSYPPIYSVPFDFIPMIWGCSDDDIAGFNAAFNTTFQGVNLTSTKDILGFNEPDLGAQANCSPEKAAQVWKDVLEPLKKKGYRLGSPAVTGGPAGKKWMQDWLEACQGECNPDFVAVHWYDIDSRDFVQHLQDFYWSFGKPIWVTEYAVMNFTTVDANATSYGSQATLIQIELFMDVTRSFMESVDWVERYFYFGAMYDMQGVNPLNTLFDVSGKERRTGALNALGVQYARSNGSVDPNAVATQSAAVPRVRSKGRMIIGMVCCTVALYLHV